MEIKIRHLTTRCPYVKGYLGIPIIDYISLKVSLKVHECSYDKKIKYVTKRCPIIPVTGNLI
jgi:hypothetical protein